MAPPNLRLLTQKELQQIHSATVEILEKTGIKVHSEDALNLLSDAGANVDSKNKLVKIPESLIDEVVKKPSRCTALYGRDPRHDVVFGEGRVYVMTDSTGIKTIDFETGSVRASTKQDLADCCRLVDGLANIQVFSTMVDALDYPEEVMRLEEFEAMLCNTGKNICHGAKGRDEAESLARMAAAVAGGTEEFRKRPMFHLMQTPVSPLVHDKENTDGILEAAKHGIPLAILNMPQGGMTAPLTMAGTIAVSNAEVLSGMLIARLVNPDVPLIYGSCAMTADIRIKDYTLICGLIESGLIAAANAQLAHYYGFPCEVGLTFGSVLDDWISPLRIMTAIMIANAKADILFGVGLVNKSTTLSFDELVVDNDLAGLVLRETRGIDVNDETLALDVISRVKPEGNFMAQQHTIKHIEKELYIPQLFDKVDPKNVHSAAKKEARQILATHKPEPLDEEVKRKLRTIIQEAKRK
jgi:trimethylamine--corrinoid protein Co-methyltransferase